MQSKSIEATIGGNIKYKRVVFRFPTWYLRHNIMTCLHTIYGINPEPAEFHKLKIPPSIFGTVHYRF